MELILAKKYLERKDNEIGFANSYKNIGNNLSQSFLVQKQDQDSQSFL
jgi:hypothetical protein